MYDHGKGVKEDDVKAEEFYTKSCYGGSGLGCYNLGVMYYAAQNEDDDNSVVKSLFREACGLGEILGCKNYRLLNKRYKIGRP